MRRFLRHTAILALPVLIVAIALEMIAEAIPNSYSYKRDYMDRHSDHLQTLILGASNAYDDIDPSLLPHAFNLANSSQSLEDDYRLLARYITQMDSLQTVIIGLGYHSLGTPQQSHRRLYYTIYMHLYPRWPVSRYSFEICDLELLSKKLIKYTVSRDVTRCDSLGQRLGHNASAVQQRKEFWNKDVATIAANDSYDLSSAALDDQIATNAAYLHAIVHLCEQHCVQPIVLTMPVMPEYKRCLSPVQIALHDSVMQGLPSAAIYIDASEWSIPADGWYNATHLTREQSVPFTTRLSSFAEVLHAVH